jgi:hypothetical protein
MLINLRAQVPFQVVPTKELEGRKDFRVRRQVAFAQTTALYLEI